MRALGQTLFFAFAFAMAATECARAHSLFANGDQDFTAAQSSRGNAVYEDNCASCHGADLNGGQFGAPLRGPTFKAHWSNASASQLLGFIVAKMPPSNPGSLTNQSYADVAALLLQSNGIAPGARELSPLPEDAEATPKSVNTDRIYLDAQARAKTLLDAMTPVTDAMLRAPPDADWLFSSRTYQSLAFSPLARINRSNVHRLIPAWSLTLPPSNNEITPLIHDGLMFLAPGGLNVMAVNAASGELLWRYTRTLPAGLYNMQAARMKSLAIFEHNLYAPTADGHIIALDAKSGRVIWDQAVIPTEQNAHVGQKRLTPLRLNGAPLVVNGKVIMGASSGHDARGGSFIVGLDGRSGEELWRFRTIARPGAPGGDSWNGAPLENRFGAGVWTIGSYDARRNLVFFGTGNTYDTDTLLLPQEKQGASNDALFTDSTVALNPDTGELVWYYQHMARDVWDMDWAFEQSLINLPINCKPTDIVLTGGKLAIFDAMERDTGKYLFSKDLGMQTLVTAIDPLTGRKSTDHGLEPENGKIKPMCPHTNGVRNWMTTAFDPRTHILYVPLLDACGEYMWIARSPSDYANGGFDTFNALRARPNGDGMFGQIEAINMLTGKVLWKHRQRAPLESSLLATAGGLVFSGSYDRLFHAYESVSGKLLWQTVLNLSPNASPVTYSVNGRQYVAIVAGGGGPMDSGAALLAPEINSPPGNATVWVYRLPD
jgi:alcohol dehydrogenase (cytochrome c)